MPRNPLNSPTERILRLLDDFDALEQYAAQVEERILNLEGGDKILFSLPARPLREAIVAERRYQQVMLQNTRTTRARMAKLREYPETRQRPKSSRPGKRHRPAKFTISDAQEELGSDLTSFEESAFSEADLLRLVEETEEQNKGLTPADLKKGVKL